MMKVRLAARSETTIQPSVWVLAPTGTYEWITLPTAGVPEAADLVRELVDLAPAIAIERVYSAWDGKSVRPWPAGLSRALASAFVERYLLPSPIEAQVSEDNGAGLQ